MNVGEYRGRQLGLLAGAAGVAREYYRNPAFRNDLQAGARHANNAMARMARRMRTVTARRTAANTQQERTVGVWEPGLATGRRRRKKVPRRVRMARKMFRTRVEKVLNSRTENHNIRFTNYTATQITYVDGRLRNGLCHFAPVIEDANFDAINSGQGGVGISSQVPTSVGFVGRECHFTSLVMHIRATIPQETSATDTTAAPLNWWVGYRVIKYNRKAVAEGEIANVDSAKNVFDVNVFGETSNTGVELYGPPSTIDGNYEPAQPKAFCVKWPAINESTAASTLGTIFRSTGHANPWFGVKNKNYTVLKQGLLCVPEDKTGNSNDRGKRSGYAKVVLKPRRSKYDSNVDERDQTNIWNYLFPDTYIQVWCYNSALPFGFVSSYTFPETSPYLTMEGRLYWKTD